jgi:E3 ubiquitin-protein transferase RMND5
MNRASELEFRLYKLDFQRIVMSCSSAASSSAIRVQILQHLQGMPPHLHTQHGAEIRRMLTSLLFLPYSRLIASPYRDLITPSLRVEVEEEFVREFCASIGLARTMPLRTLCDIGSGDAIVRIEKGRKLMREKKSEWSQVNELPVCGILLQLCVSSFSLD